MSNNNAARPTVWRGMDWGYTAKRDAARSLVLRHEPSAVVNAKYAALATVVNIHGARYLVDGDGRGSWSAKLVRPAAPMATRRGVRRSVWLRLCAAVDRAAEATERAYQRGTVRLW